MTAAMQRQKRYRQLIPMTYEEFLDEPVDVIEWTLQIDAIEQDVQRAEAERNAARGR